MKQDVYTVYPKKLALFETLMDIEPIRYMDKGEKVTLMSKTNYYGGKHKDKPYYKVRTGLFEIGYVLSDGLKAVTTS